MTVSENIFIHLWCNGRKIVALHIEETLETSFAEEIRQNFTSSKDRQTVRVFSNITLSVIYLKWRGLLFISCLGVWRYLFGKIDGTAHAFSMPKHEKITNLFKNKKK